MMNRIAACLILVLTTGVAVQAQDAAEPFLGRWSLHLPGGAGWLEVQDIDGFLDASLLWYGGSVLPVASVNVTDNTLTVTRTRSVELELPDGSMRNRTITNSLVMHRDGEGLSGTAYFPGAQGRGMRTTEFTGERIQDLPPAPDLSQAQFGEPMELLNGTDLTGWSLINPNQTNGFKAEDGMLVNDPVQPEDGSHISYGNLRTDAEFSDFRLTLEVNVPEGSNSGIYLRGIYEIQVADTYGRDSDSHHMGGLYSRIAPSSTVEKPAGEWQTMDITLYQRHLTVILNGTNIIDNQPVLGVTGGAMTADESSPGPIYLQGDHGRVLYRNLILTPILQ
ncbi:MAG: DUF1080 domain-containing protein [Bacteroidota bacterium]|nr:DUF1080 domain-containing protein [Bacteroidota bacterium]MDE2956070.1 DUF1080 domain-containing protein [Bacteroidota bacterium]